MRKKLIDEGYFFRSHSDTEVLLKSYIEWGTNCVDYLNGIFAFAVWDKKNCSLFMARDRLGVKPLFYTRRGKNIIFASEIKALLEHPQVFPIIDDVGLMQIFGLGPARPSNSGIFKDILELPPAHYLYITSEYTTMHEYWKLQSKPHEDNVSQTLSHIRNLFEITVKNQLIADVPVCTFLSGGLDSTAISSVASSFYKKNGKELHTYSIDYEDNDKFFERSVFQPDADSEWIDYASNAIGSIHHNIIINNNDVVAALKDSARANDYPGMADVDSSLLLFCKEVRKDAVVALSGECADEIFGGYPWFSRPDMIEANTFPWSQALDERYDLLHRDFKHLKLIEYVQSEYYDTLKCVPRLKGEDSYSNRMREISYLNLKWFMVTLLSRKDRMSMANSLEVRVPFADHEIVEYAWNIPIDIKYLESREKGLLRRAFEGLMPNDLIWRKKSPYPKTHNPAYLKAVSSWLNEIINDSSSPILRIVDKKNMIDLIKSGGSSFGKPWYGQLMAGPQLIAYLAQINEWMATYKLEIV